MQFTEFLTSQEILAIHDASLEILENVGLLVRSEKARDIYVRHGCKIDSAAQVVKLPRQVIDTYCQYFVPKFSFKGRDPKFDRTIPDDRPLIVTASSAPNISSPESTLLE